MSNKILVQTQNFFIDTARPESGECRDATFVLPQGLMDCSEEQSMRLTLNSFSMRNSWHRVNIHNQVYFIVGSGSGFDGTGPIITSTRVQIGEGNYHLFSQTENIENPTAASNESLANNLQQGIRLSLQKTWGTDNTTFPTIVTYDHLSGKFSIQIDTNAKRQAYDEGIKLVCFTIPRGTPIPTGNIVASILNTPHHSYLRPSETYEPQFNWIQAGTATVQIADSGANTVVDNGNGTWSINVIGYKSPGPDYSNIMKANVIQWKNSPNKDEGGGEEGDTLYAIITAVVPQRNHMINNTYTITCEYMYNANGILAAPGEADVYGENRAGVYKGFTFHFSEVANNLTMYDPGSSRRFVQFNAVTDAFAIDSPVTGPTGFPAETVISAYGVNTVGTDFIPSTATSFALSKAANLDFSGGNVELTVGGGEESVTVSNSSSVDVSIIAGLPGGLDYLRVGMSVSTKATIYPGGNIPAGTVIQSIDTVAETVTLNNPITVQSPYDIIVFDATITVTSQESKYVWLNAEVPDKSGLVFIGDNISYNLIPPNIRSPQIIAVQQDYVDFDNSKIQVFAIDHDVDLQSPTSILIRTPNNTFNTTVFNDSFQSTFEILGGCYESRGKIPGDTLKDQFDNMHSIFEVNEGVNNHSYVFEGYYPATLQSEENIYLRTDVNSTAYQTPGFDTGQQSNIASSQILAKIPLNKAQFAAVKVIEKGTIVVPGATGGTSVTRPTASTSTHIYERPFEVVYFQDNGNNEYSVMLSSKKISHLRLFVTDKFGRLLPAVSQQQIDCGAMSFTASLRVDIFETPQMMMRQ